MTKRTPGLLTGPDVWCCLVLKGDFLYGGKAEGSRRGKYCEPNNWKVMKNIIFQPNYFHRGSKSSQ